MVSFDKVQLTKAAPSVSLSKGQGAGGQMRINLNWDAGSGGGLFRKRSSVDLDLGALWETQDGGKGVVQALGNSFGALDGPPYVLLDGDDRSGSNTAGENLLVNLDHLDRIKRVLIFAYIYEGAPNWAAANGVVTMFPQGAQPVEVRLDDVGGSSKSCAIAMLSNDGGALRIDREVRYFPGVQQDLDTAYGWGMTWTAGRK